MSNKPQQLRIYGFDYTIDWNASRELMADGNWGQTDSFSNTIKVDGQASLQRQRETLLHEVLHAASYVLTSDNQPSEAQIKALAIGLFQTIRDTPDFWSFISEEDD